MLQHSANIAFILSLVTFASCAMVDSASEEALGDVDVDGEGEGDIRPREPVEPPMVLTAGRYVLKTIGDKGGFVHAGGAMAQWANVGTCRINTDHGQSNVSVPVELDQVGDNPRVSIGYPDALDCAFRIDVPSQSRVYLRNATLTRVSQAPAPGPDAPHPGPRRPAPAPIPTH